MKIIKNVTLYICDYCKKEYKRKHFAVAHEPKCRKNPVNYQPCLNGCIHLESEKMYFMLDTYQREEKTSINAFWCNKKNYWVYPYWCNNPVLEVDLIVEAKNIKMPNECKDYSCSNNDIFF